MISLQKAERAFFGLIRGTQFPLTFFDTIARCVVIDSKTVLLEFVLQERLPLPINVA
jgi:hypothetical protein